MSDLTKFLDEAKSGVAALLKEFVTKEAFDAKRVAQNLIDQSVEDLKRWTTLLAQGQLTEADYRSLVSGIGGLAEMTALKQLGLTQARLDELKGRIVETIVGSALKLIP